MSDELTELPEGWEWVKISDVAEKVGSGATPRGGSESYKLSGIPLIRSMNVHFDGLKLDGLAYLDDKQANELKNVEVKTNDVLLNITGASIGRVTQASSEMDGARVNQHVCIIRTNPVLDACFLSKYLASPSIQNWIMAEEYGATRQALTKQMILNFDIPLPPLNEQKRIVAKIEELRDRLHRSKQALEAVPELCDRFRQSVLAAAFRGDLTADWREENPDVEPASVLLERIRSDRRRKWEETELQKLKAVGRIPKNSKWKDKYQEPEPCDDALLPKLPDEWRWVPVEFLATKVVDGVHKKPNYVEYGIPFVTVRNLTAGTGISFDKLNYVSQEDHEEFFKRANPEKGDLLISKDGTLGVTRVIRTDKVFSIFVSVALVKPVAYEMSDYLELAFCSPQMQNQMLGTGSGLQHIHLKDLRRYAVPVTSLKEQEEIVVRVRQLFKAIEEIQKQYDAAKVNLDCLNQSILAKAFRGELVEQDPNDEPASVLLDRIRAEREALQSKKKSQSTKGKRKKAKDDQLDLPELN